MPTTVNGDCCVSLMSGTLVRPIARYPASIAHDDPLKVASNRIRTSLVRSVQSGDTLLTVSDASRIVPQMLLSVDSEIVSVSSVDGNILTVVRGFDGTPPCPHSSGRPLDANIVAWHHNVLAAEIEAIETALGPNLSNITGDAGPFLVSTRFVFTAAPGGSLTVGANMVTLAPVPRGVNGSDPHHYLWISGGTGTAEAVLITGGTAAGGAASGTLFFTCANAHSGAWTITSATAGIAEAAQVATETAGNLIIIPAGTHQVRATITLTHGVGLLGCSPLSSTLAQATPGVTVISVGASYGVQLQGITINGHASSASGFMVVANGSYRMLVNNCYIVNGYGGINLKGVFWFALTNSLVAAQKAQMLACDGTSNTGYLHISHCVFNGASPQPIAGIELKAMNGMYMDDTDFYQCGYGLLVAPGAGQHVGDVFIANSSFDSCTNSGVRIAPTAADAYVVRLMFSNCWSATNHDGVTVHEA